MFKPTFSFIDYTQDVTIAGKEFGIDCGSATGEYLKAKSKEIRETAEMIADEETDENAIVLLGTEIIEHVLGDGAAEEIFGETDPDVNMVLDIVSFITITVSQFAVRRMEILQGMVSNSDK